MPDIRTPQRWLAIAEEARARADKMSDPISKRMMLEVAEGYEALAGHEKFLASARRFLRLERRNPR
jgi:hypothetical protein